MLEILTRCLISFPTHIEISTQALHTILSAQNKTYEKTAGIG